MDVLIMENLAYSSKVELPVYEQVKRYLYNEIEEGRVSGGGFAPSERHLSSLLNVSRESVKRAYRDLCEEGVMEKHPFKRPLISKRFVSTGRAVSDTIANSIAFITDAPFSMKFHEGYSELSAVYLEIMRNLSQNSLNSVFFANGYFENRGQVKLREICSQGYAGIFYFGSMTEKAARTLENSVSPVVAIEAYLKREHPFHTVDIDNFYGAYVATRYLIENGHGKIAHFTFENDSLWVSERIRGFQKAMADFGLADSGRVFTPLSLNYHYGNVENIIPAEFAKGGYTACFVSSDALAERMIQLLEADGIRVPEDISIVGFDNFYMEGRGEILTTVSHMTKEMGIKAAEIFLGARKNPDYTFRELIRPKLVLRNSVRRIDVRAAASI